MNWAIGHGSSGGRCGPQLVGKWRIRTRTSSLLQSQKLVSSSRSSSGVSRSDEKVVGERFGRPWPTARIAYAWRSSWRPFSADASLEGSWLGTGIVTGSYKRGGSRVSSVRGLIGPPRYNPFVPSPTGQTVGGGGRKKIPDSTESHNRSAATASERHTQQGVRDGANRSRLLSRCEPRADDVSAGVRTVRRARLLSRAGDRLLGSL